MRLAGIEIGDLVYVDVRGRQFMAIVDGAVPRSLAITPLRGSGVNIRLVGAGQVKAHYRRRGGAAPRHVLTGGSE